MVVVLQNCLRSVTKFVDENPFLIKKRKIMEKYKFKQAQLFNHLHRYK